MLGKLMKYEIKATARTFLPVYIVLLVFALINRLMASFSHGSLRMPEIISMSLYIIILIGMFVMTFIVMITRFYKNLLSDEGYLMFTLPTKIWKHIISKLLISMMWMVTSLIIAFISIMIIASKEVAFSDITLVLRLSWLEAYRYLGSSVYLVIAEILIAAVISMISGILIIYASIALGHLFNRHKILASFGAFLILNTLTQIVSAIAAKMMIKPTFHSMYYAEVTPLDPVFNSIMLFAIILSTIMSVAYFTITNMVLTKRLNLE